MAEATDAIAPTRIPTPDRLITPLVRQRLSPLAWKRFVPAEVQVAPQIEISEAEVQNKCFAVLGYLEEYYLPSSSEVAEIKDVDLNKKSGLEQLEQQLDSVLHLRSGAGEGQPQQRQRHAQIERRLSELLAVSQVRGRFEKEFNEELPRYLASRRLMREVRDIDRVTRKLRKAIYKRYLDDKQEHGKLTQSSVDQIYFFQGKLGELEQQKEGLEDTASPATLGYLETQKLLDYKRQLQEKGFVMTPSREHLIDRITREALAGKKIFLVGSTGTGKTQLAFYALNNLTGGYELINWHEGTTPRDLFGYRELWTDELGGVQSGMKPGPVPKALERGVGVIHEEYTGGSTRTQLAAKFMMGARPGDRIQIPGFNGQVFDVTNNFVEVFTGNPKDERTKQREDMDPAILRELTGVEVSYMSAPEMDDIIRARLITESGVLRLSQVETEYVERLTKAAEMMQRIHNRDFEGFSTEIRSLLGIDAQGNTDTTLNTNFLDPGTLFKLFSEWELASARGQNFESYMGDKLGEFITDPKTLSSPEERKALQKILHAFGLITRASGDVRVSISHQDKGYILPSEMAGEITLSKKNPMHDGKTETPPSSVSVEIQEAQRLFGDKFFGPEQVESTFDIHLNPDQIPAIGEYLVQRGMSREHLEQLAAAGFRFVLRINKAKDGSPLTMEKMEKDLRQKFDNNRKGKILYTTSPYDWYINSPKETFYESETPQFEWALVYDGVVSGTRSKDYLQQTEVIIDYLQSTVFNGQALPSRYQEAVDEFETKKANIQALMTDMTWKQAAGLLSELKITQVTRHTPPEVIYDMIMATWKDENTRFLPDMWTWTKERARGGCLVHVGHSGVWRGRRQPRSPVSRFQSGCVPLPVVLSLNPWFLSSCSPRITYSVNQNQIWFSNSFRNLCVLA